MPFNHLGYQWPAHGDGYVGLATYSHNDFDYREIITSELTEPLQPGVPVYASFKTTCGGYGSIFWNSAKWKARGPGVKFFVDLPTDWSSYLYPNSAAVYMDTVLSDTSAVWVTVSGAYVPDSAYQYVAITNFFEDSLSWPSIQDQDFGTLAGAYAFIDEVCVSLDPEYCSIGSGMFEASPEQYVILHDQAAGILTLRSTGLLARGTLVVVQNAAGQVLFSAQWPTGDQELRLQTGQFPAGIYLVTITGSTTALRFVNLSP